MKCPRCGKELRRSKKDPSYGLCDHCRKKFRWVESETANRQNTGSSLRKRSAGSHKKRKRSRLPLIFFILILLAAAGIGFLLLRNNGSGKKAAADRFESADSTLELDGNGFHISYTRHETGTDTDGNPCLLYYYEYTNSSGKDASPSDTVLIQAFQNGLSCNTAVLEKDIDKMENYLSEIPDGTTVEVCQAYSLTDSSSVIMEAKSFLSADDNTDTQQLDLEDPKQ